MPLHQRGARASGGREGAAGGGDHGRRADEAADAAMSAASSLVLCSGGIVGRPEFASSLKSGGLFIKKRIVIFSVQHEIFQANVFLTSRGSLFRQPRKPFSHQAKAICPINAIFNTQMPSSKKIMVVLMTIGPRPQAKWVLHNVEIGIGSGK